MKDKRILVTGAGGFIGHHLVRFLKRKGYWVRGVDIKYPEFSSKDEADDFLLLDLRDFRNCMKAVKGIDKVYTLACYDEKTEVLTEEGFKLFNKLKDDDRVATLNKDGYLEYQRPSKFYKYHYEGEMIHFQGRFIDLLVTPNHKMFIKRPAQKDWELREAEKCNLVQLRFKRDARWIGKESSKFLLPQRQGYHFNTKIKSSIKMEDFLEFLGFYLAEGSIRINKKKGTYRIHIANQNPKVIKKVKEVVKRIGYTPYEDKSSSYGINFCSKQLLEYLEQFGRARKKFIPKEIKQLSPRLLKILFNALMIGDGDTRKRTYYTSSTKLADDFQEICLKLGYAVSLKNRKREEGGKIIRISKKSKIPMIVEKPQRVQYRSWVYCVEVPNHIIFVRRNGKTAWCGNSNMGGIGFITEVGADVMYDNVLINTYIAKACLENKVKRLFFSSSACIYPTYKQEKPDVKPLKEDDAYPADPDNFYGWEKIYTEKMLEAFKKDYGLDIRIARYHNCYGPEGTYKGGREKSPAALCRKVAEASNPGEIEIWGDGKQTRSFLYIDDCLEGTHRLMETDFREPLNIGSDRLVTIDELADIIIKISGKKITKKYNLKAPQGVRGRNADLTLVKKVLGWEPKTTLEEGLKRTYEWILSQIKNGK